LLILSAPAGAQDFKEALLKMKGSYAEAAGLRIVMSIKASDANKPESIFYQQKAEVKKEGSRYFYDVDGMTMLLNENYLVMVNQKLKQILITKNRATAASQFENQFKFNIDSLLTAFGTSSYQGRSNQTDHYKIVHKKNASIEQTDMFFGAETGLLKTIKYTYRSGQNVTIDFDVFEINPIFNDNTFTENEYFSVNNDQLTPTKKYSSYRIVDTEGTKKTN
jgi:outer membrane lipoprotein-sorting protein